MILQPGPGHGSHFASPSTHNPHRKRLWRDVYHCVSSTYLDVFYIVNTQQILDPEKELLLFVLQCVFLRQINCFLKSFSSAWNQHPLRTKRMWSPRKMWMNGMIRADCVAITQCLMYMQSILFLWMLNSLALIPVNYCQKLTNK